MRPAPRQPMKSPVLHVVDDNPSVRKSVRRLLRSMGFEVELYADAEQFLAVDVTGPGCLILDVQLPGMCGLDLQDALAESGSALRIIFMTANPEPHVRRRALAAGACAFLAKPFDDHTLLEAVERALQ